MSTAGQLEFSLFYHPYTCEFVSKLACKGVAALLAPENSDLLSRQRLNDEFFGAEYKPVADAVAMPYPIDEISFKDNDANAPYNWELFFHIPFLVAQRLSENQRFEEAHTWFSYIFDPTISASLPIPGRYWRTQPFFDNSKAKFSIGKLLELLHAGSDVDLAKTHPELIKTRKQFRVQIKAWRENPFNPHLIARLRMVAYQKNVVMKYLDNILAWGDSLFARETMEAINEASQLYILAATILGMRPEELPAVKPKPETFKTLKARGLGEFSNAAVPIEGLLPPSSPVASSMAAAAGTEASMMTRTATSTAVELGAILPLGVTLYFCTPRNENLLKYWDLVADRLFKIRHCMNIDGVIRQLPLFEPPIDPALLVRATALGLDLSTVLNELYAPLPHYRFSFMLQKAMEFCTTLQGLGAGLLAAIEKRDVEHLTRMRSTHEIKLLKATRDIRRRQVEEAQRSLEALQQTKAMVQIRHDYYSGREQMNEGERQHLDRLAAATGFQVAGQLLEAGASIAHLLPDVTAKVGTPDVTTGGSHIGRGLEAYSRGLGAFASIATFYATRAATMAGYERRADEWKLQADLAATELKQVDKQIAGAEIRQAIAEKELANLELQSDNAAEADAFMRSKFTNEKLFDWMTSQVSALYFQSYQVAYTVARQAERGYRYELGLPDSAFIRSDNWDSLKKGLLAGERLHHDLQRMEAAHFQQNRREFEITKSISLALLNPLELVRLKQTGSCTVDLTEDLFNLDYPGHHLRRIKSVGLSLPCVAGPYTSVNCTLTLLKNWVRIKPTDDPGSGLTDNWGAVQSVATSNAQNDSGLFELNFRDERYLPFEGAGAISTWHLELPRESNQFDFNTISDVILHLRYTARDGGAVFRKAVLATLPTAGSQLFSVKHEFPSEWQRFLHPTAEAPERTLALDLGLDRFPFLFRRAKVLIRKVRLFVNRTDAAAGHSLELFLTPPGAPTNRPASTPEAATKLRSDPDMGNVLSGIEAYRSGKALGQWRLIARRDDIAPIEHLIEDLWIVCDYSAAVETS